MANEPSKTPAPQRISLSKIHDLPGVFITRQPDKAYGGLVSSILSGGVREPVILRRREDGEYQLVTGYRRLRASELAKLKDIPALVYDMTMQEAIDYHRKVKNQPDLPIPGKLLTAQAQEKAPSQDPAAKKDEKPAEPVKDAAQGKDGKEQKPDGPTDSKDKSTPAQAGKEPEKPAVAAAPKKDEKPAEPVKDAAQGKDGKDQKSGEQTDSKDKPAPTQAGKEPEKPAQAAAPKKDEKPTEPVKDATQDKDGKDQKSGEQTDSKDKSAPTQAGKEPEKPAQAAAPKKDEKPTEPVKGAAQGKDGKEQMPTAKPAAQPVKPMAPTGPAARGPAGTAITQVFPGRLAPPDEKALKDLPAPKEGESFFITLHPDYLEKSKFNNFSVDTSSENYKELLKSVELVGIKDPVLARLKPEGGLEILSGQRRHLAAKELNYPVPAIIQKIDDADAKIIVADGNLHRDKISTYDLSRALRMKMEGMKQKAGRRKKGAPTADELNSDVKLAAEMGMSVSKLNRIIRLSEATKDVCDRVDDGSLTLSVASAISFLKPENQDEVLHLTDLGYKVTNERIERMKKVDKSGKLTEGKMRDILDDKDIAPKQVIPPAPTPAPQPAAAPQPTAMNNPAPEGNAPAAPVPASPDVPAEPTPAAPAASVTGTPEPTQAKQGDDDIFKGNQERPEVTKVILTGDRLRKYFPDVSMTPREIEESVYEALEERRQRQERAKQKESIFKVPKPTR